MDRPRSGVWHQSQTGIGVSSGFVTEICNRTAGFGSGLFRCGLAGVGERAVAGVAGAGHDGEHELQLA